MTDSAMPPRAVGRVSPVAAQTALLVALTFVSGVTDATAFTRLGGVFTSVMTGNLVILGSAVGRDVLATVGRTALAIGCYIAGAVLGASVAGTHQNGDPPWHRRVTLTLVIETALFCAFAVGWWSSGSAPGHGTADALLGVCALALGMQSSAIVRLGLSGVSTTYLTGTLTTLAHSLVTKRNAGGTLRPSLILISLVVGGCLGALVAKEVPTVQPALVLVPLAGVLVAGLHPLLAGPRGPVAAERPNG